MFEVSTRRGYVTKIETHIRPLLGSIAVGNVDAEILESFYAVLRRCREHCNGRRHLVNMLIFRHRLRGPG